MFSCLQQAGERNFFHLIFTEPGKHTFAGPCIWQEAKSLPDLKVDVDGAAIVAADLPGALLVGIVVAGVVGGSNHACPRIERSF